VVEGKYMEGKTKFRQKTFDSFSEQYSNGYFLDKNHDIFVERYKIHQYWSRKPWYVVRKYIEKYSNIGDLVLDPFVGGGVTAFEALALKRGIIARDLNPTSILLTKIICENEFDLNLFKNYFIKIMENIPPNIRDLYKTKCRQCGNDLEFINAIRNKEIPTYIYIHCHNCGFKGIVEPIKEDIIKIDTIKNIIIDNWYPKNIPLPKDADVKFVDQLHTKRNLIALSELRKLIDLTPDIKYKNALLLMLISTTTRTTKCIFINKYRFSKGVNPAGVWGEKRFWVPQEYIENNVVYYFNERFDKLIKAKEETNRILNSENLIRQIEIGSAQKLIRINDNSIDYIFTDPPYAGAVKYLDLSTVWNAWLDQLPVKSDEIVLYSGQKYNQYFNELKIAIEEMFRVIKPHKYLSICFHFSNLLLWKKTLDLLGVFNYIFDQVEIISPQKKSHNQITMKGTMDTDVIITFQKDKRETLDDEDNFIQGDLKVSNIVKEYLHSVRNCSFKTTELYDIIVKKMAECILTRRQTKIDIDILNIKDLEQLLLKEKIKNVIYYEKDYKGIDREILKWEANNE